MMNATRMWLLAAIVTASATTLAQEDRFKDVVVEPTPVMGTVYMLTGAGGNVGVSAGPDGLLIVDDQYAPLAERIAAAVAGVANSAEADTTLRYVINTHFHGDHTGSNAFFGAQGAAIVAHENVRVRLLGAEKPDVALPVITHGDGINIYFNGDKLVLTALKGHTDGDSAVYFTKANVLHTGDLLFNGRFPYIDLDSGGSVQDYLDSQAQMLAMINDETRVIPGHGPLGTKADLQAMHDMIKTTHAMVKADVEAGLSLEAIVEKGVAPEYQHLSWAFINEVRWLTLLHKDITGG